MVLSDVIQTSNRSLRDLAGELGCSHNHLSQVANLKKPLSAALGLKITKKLNPLFSTDEQQEAYEAAARKRARAQKRRDHESASAA
jgi:plasmid maintenance system antidote protein VapI